MEAKVAEQKEAIAELERRKHEAGDLPSADDILETALDLDEAWQDDISVGRQYLRRLFRDGSIDMIRDGFVGGRVGDRVLRQLVGEVRVVLRSNSMSGQAIAARGGVGVALLPRFMDDPEPGLERLFVVESEQPAHLYEGAPESTTTPDAPSG